MIKIPVHQVAQPGEIFGFSPLKQGSLFWLSLEAEYLTILVTTQREKLPTPY